MFYNILLTLGGPYLTEASPSICKENQWTGFYTIGTSVAKEFRLFLRVKCLKINLLLCLQKKLFWCGSLSSFSQTVIFFPAVFILYSKSVTTSH